MFKLDIDDLRESSVLNITKKITELYSGMVIAVEPNVKKLPINITTFELSTFNNAKDNADIHELLVEHKEFKLNKTSSAYVIDTKVIWK